MNHYKRQARRDFLKSLGGYAALTGAASMGMPLSLFANNGSSLTGYKALIVILQHGGNDSINMFIPNGSDAKKGYENYAAIRTSLRVDNENLPLTVNNNRLVLSAGATNPYYRNSSLEAAYTKGFYPHAGIEGLATNGVMPELAHLVNQGKVAMIANAGNLIYPTTKADILSKSAQLPPFLYSHNSQRRLILNGFSTSLKRTAGWAGLIADEWNTVNSNSIYGMNMAIGSSSAMLRGQTTIPLLLSSSGPEKYLRIKREVYDNWLKTKKPEHYSTYYNALRKHSFSLQDTLGADWENNAPLWTSKNAYGDDLFSMPTTETLGIKTSESLKTSFLNDLKAVAKWAYIGKQKGLKRQIFYVRQGGYDTHSNQNAEHAQRLRALSLGLGDLQLALNDMGMGNDVTTFNISDFGRSIGNNGNGTDHGWGAHHFVMGGAVTGGLYGTLPDLTLGADDDASKKGRLIPTTSMSQYLATTVKWFGADEAMLQQLFPELNHFNQRDLGFMG
ncbi:MAG: DUF1501 domain-containing protein [Cocleimonas sp.]|nr:DUF1501 domain-containing protein [Cocleimonas sp.]